MHAVCCVYCLLLLITWHNSRIVLIFMKPKGHCTSVVKDYAYRHWKENVPVSHFTIEAISDQSGFQYLLCSVPSGLLDQPTCICRRGPTSN